MRAVTDEQNRARGSRALIEQASLIEHHSARARQAVNEFQRELHNDPAMALSIAEPMYCAARCCDLVSEASRKIPDWPLAPWDLLVPTAFMWLERPLPVFALSATMHERDIPIFAWSWALWVRTNTANFVGKYRINPPKSDGVKLFAWQVGMEAPFQATWAWGETRQAVAETIVFNGVNDPRLSQEDQALLAAVPRDQTIDLARCLLTVFQASISFIKQRIFVKERVTPDRSARKLAGRVGLRGGETTVITLRRVMPAVVNNEEESPVDWAARWWVQGHWRMQACGPDWSERRPTWISPFVKGPEDKPLGPAKPRRFDITR